MFFIATGLVMGSFLCLVASRISRNLSILGRSRCDFCQVKLNSLSLIPIVSYLYLRKCSHCHTPINSRSTFIEFLTAAYFYCFRHDVFSILLYCMLLIISLIDWDTYTIYDRFHLYLVILGLFTPISLNDKILGLFVVSIPLLLFAHVTRGLGGGDVKLFASLGFLMGTQRIFMTLTIASILGSLFGLLKKIKKNTMIPFAPFIALGALITWNFYPILINLYRFLHPFL